MYSDSRLIDYDPDFYQYVDSLLLQAGSIHVYKLVEAKSDSIRNLPFHLRKKK